MSVGRGENLFYLRGPAAAKLVPVLKASLRLSLPVVLL